MKVGVVGFEPTASCTPFKRASQVKLLPCGTREEAYNQTVDLPQPGLVELLLDDEDGVFELRGGKIHGEKLWMFVKNLSGSGESIYDGGAR